MMEIQLSDGKHVAIVDDADYSKTTPYVWHAQKIKGKYYASANVTRDVARKLGVKIRRKKGKRNFTRVYLHRVVTDFKIPLIDHRDGDPLNCTRENIRSCNYSQNAANQAKTKRAVTSIYKGVHSRRGKWKASIGRLTKGGRYLGTFKTEVEAAMAYDDAAVARWGPFARVNFPDRQLAIVLSA